METNDRINKRPFAMPNSTNTFLPTSDTIVNPVTLKYTICLDSWAPDTYELGFDILDFGDFLDLYART
jgi:hypothetical protein